jgi:hypothetical protein
MLKQVFFGLTFALFLIGCNSHPAANAGKDSLANQSADSGLQNNTYHPGILTIAPALLKKYKEACLHDTASYDKKFVSNFFDLIEKQYKAYLRDFKGDLLTYGQPESREGLWIWYKPAGRMITYYHP